MDNPKEYYDPLLEIRGMFIRACSRAKKYKNTPTGEKARATAEHLFKELKIYIFE